MLVSKLLQELKISFKRLIRYNEFLETPITSPAQELDENTHLQIIALYNNKEVQNQLDNTIINEQIVSYNGFLLNDECKFIAKIKWYYDEVKQGDYGFAYHDKLKDIFFHSQAVKGIDPHKLSANDTVIIGISKDDFINNRRKIKAISLYKLDYETDLTLFIYFGIIKNHNDFLSRSKTIIQEENFEISKNVKHQIENLFTDYFNGSEINIDKVVSILNIVPKLNIDITNQQVEKINTTFDSSQKFKLFLYTNFLLPVTEIEEQLIEFVLHNPYQSNDIIAKLDTPDIKRVLEKVFDKAVLLEDKDKLEGIFELLQTNNISVDYKQFSSEQLAKLWLNNILDTFPNEAIYKYLFQLKKAISLTFNGDIKNELNRDIKLVFEKLTKEELVNLFSKAHYQLDEIKSLKTFEETTFFVKYTKDEALKKSLLEKINSKATDFIKLHLFLSNYTNSLEYHNTVVYTGLLSSKDQKIFFKKVLMLIETKVLDLTLNDLNKITTFNYTDNEYAKEIDGVGLDFTLSVILKIATDLNNNQITAKNSIFGIIANQIKTPKDLLVIEGFFSKCIGRSEAKAHTITNDTDGVATYYTSRTDKKPRFSNFCDGTKAINVNTGEPVLSRKENLEFWWCENVPCFETCRSPVNSANWKNYSLQDVLRILNINYSERQYEIVLNVINRVNRFLEHLKCKSCASILRPNGKSNYGFYGVSIFSCTNKDCEKPDKDVYLSHCLNGKCEDFIDSRTTVKCKPSSLENPDKCGWYICNNCYACCSSEKLRSRKNNLNRLGQEYNCHLTGHRDLGIVCCTECGTETNRRIINSKLYQQQLAWFKSMVNTQSIESSGERRDGKWWFRWRRGDLTDEAFYGALESLKNNSFQVPNIETGDDVQFIAEPLKDYNVFHCSNCEHVIDLSDEELFDYSRVKAIKDFHNVIYPNAVT